MICMILSFLQIIGTLERRDDMAQNRKNADLVEPSIMSTDAHEPRNEKDTKNAKLASKPKVEGGILGDDGITGRIR
jgi:hypothetical protein